MGVAAASSSVALGTESAETKGNDVQDQARIAEADLIVVGGGGAGVCAAIEAAQAGATVLVLDKNDFPGGDTVRSGGMIMAAGTDVQADLGIEDTIEDFIATEVGYSASTTDTDMVIEMCEKSPEQIAFMQSLGRNFNAVDGTTMAAIAAYDGDGSHWDPRTHWDTNARTGHFVILYNHAVDLGVRFVNAVHVAHLVQDGTGAVIGVTDTEGNAYRANKGVVISTASFGRNIEMSKRYNKMNAWALGFEENFPGASLNYQSLKNTGDGIRMAQEIGADLQLNPSGCISDCTATGFYSSGTILVNDRADRFVQEDAAWGYVNQMAYNEAVKRGCADDTSTPRFWAIGAQEALEDPNDSYVTRILGGVLQGPSYNDLIQYADTLDELAEKTGLPADRLVVSVDRWNTFAETGYDEDFGRTPASGMPSLISIKTGPYYAMPYIPFSMGSFGGLRTNSETQVLNTAGDPIPRLYAAGASMSGMYTAPFYNSCGWSVLGTMVWGRKAGANVAALDAWTSDPVEDAIVVPDLEAEAQAGIDSANGSYAAGTYTSCGIGRGGEFEVTVECSDTAITAVTVGENSESGGIGTWAIEWMPLKVLAAQSADVDVVAGATQTSLAILMAVRECLDEASK